MREDASAVGGGKPLEASSVSQELGDCLFPPFRGGRRARRFGAFEHSTIRKETGRRPANRGRSANQCLTAAPPLNRFRVPADFYPVQDPR
jgi:hypothetical protein